MYVIHFINIYVNILFKCTVNSIHFYSALILSSFISMLLPKINLHLLHSIQVHVDLMLIFMVCVVKSQIQKRQRSQCCVKGCVSPAEVSRVSALTCQKDKSRDTRKHSRCKAPVFIKEVLCVHRLQCLCA